MASDLYFIDRVVLLTMSSTNQNTSYVSIAKLLNVRVVSWVMSTAGAFFCLSRCWLTSNCVKSLR